MDQSIAKQFGRALVFLLEKEGRGAQTRLAREREVDRGYLNAIIQGRKTGSENVRSKIAAHFQMPYDEMLALGRRLLEEPGLEREHGGRQYLERPSPKAEIMPGEKGEVSNTESSSLCISEKIRKAIEILKTDTENQLKFADLIDTFHRELMTKKENAGLRLQLEEMDKRIVHLEKKLIDEKGCVKQ